MSDTYVLVHGAWHTGAHLEPTADALRARGHVVHCPTLAGNRPDDDRSRTGLDDAARSLLDYLEQHDLSNVRLVGHSYGGMLLSVVADRATARVRRLVYANAFVPLDGESLMDLVPPHYRALFNNVAAANGGAVSLPFEVWRDAFINDADAAFARAAYEQLNAQPYGTFTEPARLSRPTAALAVGKSYLNCREDIALPHSLPWHPRLSERLGLFRYIECDGSHELLLTDPARFAAAIERAGRD